MTDVVKRLRQPPFGTETSERNLMNAAADEIERLRQQVAAAEIGLLVWDEGQNSEYWLRYPERAGNCAETQD